MFARKLIQCAVLLAAVLGLDACALSEDSVHVPYQAQGSAIPGAEQIHVTVKTADARTSDRTRISTKVNGYGMDMAAIRSADNIADLVKTALEDNLRIRGYKLDGGGTKVQADVKTFYNKFLPGVFSGTADATVDVVVTVTDAAGHVLYTHDEPGEAKEDIQVASGSNAAETLGKAMGIVFQQLFADPAFVAALQGHASAGMPTS